MENLDSKEAIVRIWRLSLKKTLDQLPRERQLGYALAIRDIMPVLITYGVPMAQLPPIETIPRFRG